MDKKIALLSRVSSIPQDIEPQTKELIQAAINLGYSKENMIIIESVESAIKLSEEERLGLQKLKYSIETDNVDCVIVWECSRLARQQKTLYSIRDYLFEKHIQLYILHPKCKLLDENGNIDPTSNIVFSIFASMSENEMMIKKERFTRAKNVMKEHGQKFAGAVIFGYMKDENKLCVPHPVNSKIIIDTYNHYANTDDSYYETYMWLNKQYPQQFPIVDYIKAQHKIHHFFERDIYYKGNWCYPPLISEDIYNKVREKSSKAQCKARYQSKRDLLCRGKIYCAQCNHMMTPSGGNTRAYICPTDKKHSCQINFDIADMIMWEEVRTLININASIDNRSKYEEILSMIKDKEVQINQYDTLIEDCKSKREKLVDLYMNNRIDSVLFNTKLDQLNKDEKQYTARYVKLHIEKKELTSVLEETQKSLITPTYINVDSINDFDTRLEFVRKYVKRMLVHKTEKSKEFRITFEFNFPLITNKSEYLYVYKNQRKRQIYRINDDDTMDLL